MELCDLYWLAGILEGEGTFVSGPPSQPNSPIARISMTDLDTVTRAAGLLERAVTPVRARKPHYKPVFNTQIKGAEAVALMMAVGPILGPDRTRQIDRVLAGWAPRRRSSSADPGRFPVLDPIDDLSAKNGLAMSWLAGLLEGEGTFSFTCDAKQRCYPVVSVNMCASWWCAGQLRYSVLARSRGGYRISRTGDPRTSRRSVAPTQQSGCEASAL